jgi:hypothetical protein
MMNSLTALPIRRIRTRLSAHFHSIADRNGPRLKARLDTVSYSPYLRHRQNALNPLRRTLVSPIEFVAGVANTARRRRLSLLKNPGI